MTDLVVVLGATGGTGRATVLQALQRGHRVRALVRRPGALDISHPSLSVTTGDVVTGVGIAGAFDGAACVVSALGSHTGRKPTAVYSAGLCNVRAEMARVGTRRLVAVSAMPAGDPRDKNIVDRYIAHPILGLFFGGSYADLRVMESDLRASRDVDWTVLRPPRLLDGEAKRSYCLIPEGVIGKALTITRSDLATALLDVAGDRNTVGKIFTVSN